MANRYWVGGTGNWSDTAHWSATSGGASGASVPTSTDDVIFDANSFSAVNQTVTLNSDAVCKNFNATGVSKSGTVVARSASQIMNIYGSLVGSSNVEIRPYAIHFMSASAETITWNGMSMVSGRTTDVYFDGSGSWTLQDDLVSDSWPNGIQINSGSFDTNGHSLSGTSLNGVNAGASLILGNSTWDAPSWSISSSATLNAGTSTIIMNSGGFPYFSGGGKTYYNVEFRGTSTLTLSGSNTFNNFTIVNYTISYTNIKFTAGTTQTINGTFSASSTNPNNTIQSTVAGSQFTLSKSSGTVTVTNLTYKDSNVTGGAVWDASDASNTDNGNNTGWYLNRPPTPTTGTASGTTIDTIGVSGSSISNPDSQTISEYGVVYSTTTNPTIADSKQTGTGTSSSYNNSLTGLTENTTYYIRAYALWGASNTPAYGSQVTYKTQGRATITLDSPAANASVSGTKPNLKFTGTDADNNTITYELQVNTTNAFTSPLIDKLSAADTGFTDLSTVKTDPFYSGNQIQYAVQTDLTRGQDYYWRVRGKDVSGSNTWGDWTTSQKFTVAPVVATLTTTGAHDIAATTAQVDANITADGGATVTERGICWSTSTDPTISDSKAIDAGTGTGTFTGNMTGLTGSTTYYVRAYAINSVGTAYGNNINFTTAVTPAAPTVVTGAASSTSDITSRFNGNNVTADGTFTVTERGIVFSDTNATPTTADRKIVAPTAGLGSYDLLMTGLDPATLYYVRAYAINSYGTGYGSVVSFTTADAISSDVGDGYWTWSPGQSQATVGRTQATLANSSVNLPLSDLGLTNGLDYTFYFGSVDYDFGSAHVTLERYNGATKITDTVTAGTPFTFTYDETYIHWNIRLFVTAASTESNPITAVFNDLYLAQESSFSGYVPFVRRGITELKLVNNQIVDGNREDVIGSIYDQVNGISWYPFSVDTEGLGYFEVGDRFSITDGVTSKSVVVWNTKLTIDGSIKETLYTNKPDLTETDYSKAGNARLRGNIRQTKLQVDKQQGTIDALVSDMYDLDGVVNTKYTELLQDNESIVATVQGAGGVNLIKNSVMYAFDDTGLPDSWTMTGAGSLVIQDSPESLAAGAVSGNAFTLNNKTATQTVTVRKDVDFVAEADKTYYSVSARVKKNVTGAASITLTNRNETLTIDLPDQTGYYWDVVSIEAILPKDDHYDIAITSDSDANLQVTDLILAPGQTRHEWTQANGEVMNSTVAITEDGITIRSSTFKNNYTKIDALGFEVHKTTAGGERIFGFNDDETNVSKLKADDQIAMTPMRVVPVVYSTYSGWAFTKENG